MFRSFIRLCRYRLVIPILRGKNRPVFTARGVLVGLICATTPLVGMQMAMVAGVWGIQRLVAPEWRFNVVVAMGWTWITNVFTLPPIYYLFLVTGRFDAWTLGRATRIRGILGQAGGNPIAGWWRFHRSLGDHRGHGRSMGFTDVSWMRPLGDCLRVDWISLEPAFRLAKTRRDAGAVVESQSGLVGILTEG